MTTDSTGAELRPYLRALGEAALDIVSAGTWIAAAELPPARRRMARTALVAVTVAMSVPGFRAARSAAEDTSTPSTQDATPRLPFVDAGIRLPDDDPSGTPDASRKQAVRVAAMLTAAAAVSLGSVVAGRHLERRWLARLARHGHPHPHRALAVRASALYAAVVVPSRLLAARQEALAQAANSSSSPAAV